MKPALKAPLSIRLRLEHLRKQFQTSESRAAHLASYLHALGEIDPEAAARRVNRELVKHPGHQGLLLIRLELLLRDGSLSDIRKTLKDIAEAKAPKPYWFDRLCRALRNGVISQGAVRLASDVKLIDPLILRAIARGGYESQEGAILATKLEASDRILELGAGIGYIGLLAQSLFPGIPYRGAEANAALAPLVARNQELNAATIDIRFEALGEGDGERDFYVDRRFWASSFTPIENALRIDTVPIRDLNVVIDTEKPTFLVIDIEGGEFELAPKIRFGSVRKAIIEIHPSRGSPAEVSAVYRAFLDAGFLLDAEISHSHVLYFERPA